MSLLQEFARVTRNTPCPVCGSTDWCMISRTHRNGAYAAICPRTENRRPWGEAGYYHWPVSAEVDPALLIPREAAETPVRDFGALNAEFSARCSKNRVEAYARSLGVSVTSLLRLGIGWTGSALSFPMRRPAGMICGIQLRYPGGRKRAIRGTRLGLFLPFRAVRQEILCIAEGASDTAALLDLGFDVVGRASCRVGAEDLAELVRRRRTPRLVIFGDNDEPGVDGARKLHRELARACDDVRLVFPPDDLIDTRDWRTAGASRDDVLERIWSRTRKAGQM